METEEEACTLPFPLLLRKATTAACCCACGTFASLAAELGCVVAEGVGEGEGGSRRAE